MAKDLATLKIGGMSCSACAQTIERALKKAKGVITASVNFASKQAAVEFDPMVTNFANKMIKLDKMNIFILIFIFILFTNYTFADVKTDIYSKIKCLCCEKDLKTCVCPHSKEIKAYIEALLDMELNEEGVFIKVAKEYSLDAIIDEKMRGKIEKKLIEEAGDKRPEIFIKPLSYNFGKVSKSKGKLELVVELQNKGNEALTISNLKTSCDCTTVKLKTKDGISPAFGMKDVESDWKVDLDPREKGELIITTDLNHPHVKLGHMLRIIEIKSNDPVHSLIKVEFEAEIVE